MKFRHIVRAAAAAVLIAGFSGGAIAQPKPSAAAIATAKEIVELKGATRLLDPVIAGAIEYHKGVMLQANPNLARDINEIAQKIHQESVARRPELHAQIVEVYAQHFTEQELKDLLAFYKTPLGKKLIAEEPKILDDTMARGEQWSQKFAQEILAKMRAEMKKKGHNIF